MRGTVRVARGEVRWTARPRAGASPGRPATGPRGAPRRPRGRPRRPARRATSRSPGPAGGARRGTPRPRPVPPRPRASPRPPARRRRRGGPTAGTARHVASPSRCSRPAQRNLAHGRERYRAWRSSAREGRPAGRGPQSPGRRAGPGSLSTSLGAPFVRALARTALCAYVRRGISPLPARALGPSDGRARVRASEGARRYAHTGTAGRAQATARRRAARSLSGP